MPSVTEEPVTHVVSFRVNDDDKEILKKLAMELDLSISSLMRIGLHLLERGVSEDIVTGLWVEQPNLSGMGA